MWINSSSIAASNGSWLIARGARCMTLGSRRKAWTVSRSVFSSWRKQTRWHGPKGHFNRQFPLPDYKSIRDPQCKLSANGASAPTNLGGGQHGYLALTLKPEVYFNLTGNVLTPPTDPRTVRIIVQGMDAAQTAILEKQHKELRRCLMSTPAWSMPWNN